MALHPHAWTEAMLEALPPDEHDFQEFKGSRWLVDGADLVPSFIKALSKQLSAFANASGGRLFIGLDDRGRIDGGVPVDVKGGTREWLEDVIPGALEPTLRGFGVFEVRREGRDSAIREGHAVYVVDIPGSDHAPHMAIDRRYYLRIAGKSRPMGHVHVQDVLRRTRHPQVELARVGPYGEPEYDDSDPRGPRAFVCLQVFVANRGRTLAHHVGVDIELPRNLVSRAVRARILDGDGLQLTQQPGAYTFFRYHPTPLFPGQEIYLSRVWVGLHASNEDEVRSGAQLRWRVYADDAPPSEGHRTLHSYRTVRRALTGVAERRVRRARAAEDEQT